MSCNYPVFIIPMIVNLYTYRNQLMSAKKLLLYTDKISS